MNPMYRIVLVSKRCTLNMPEPDDYEKCLDEYISLANAYKSHNPSATFIVVNNETGAIEKIV